MEHRKKRRKQFRNLMTLTQEEKGRRTMEDISEKVGGKLAKKPYSELTASQKRGRLLTNSTMKAYNPKECVVWHSLFMPSELFYAMDIVPYSTEMVAAGLSGAGLSRRLVETGEEHSECMDSCSFVTCSVGGTIEDILPEPDIFVTTSQLCDPAKKLARLSAHKYGRKEFYIDVPYGGCSFSPGEYNDAVDYLARQLEDMVKFIERETGKELDEDKLAQVIKFSNEAREWFLKIWEIRRGPALIRGRRALDFSSVLLNIWGTEEAAEIFKTWYEELEKKAEEGNLPDEKYRLIWIHLRPYYDNTIIDYLEEARGAYIIGEEVNYVFWDKLDPKEPYRSIARKILANPAYSPMDVRFEIYDRVAKEYRLDGWIGFAHKGCRHYYSSLHMTEEHFRRGVPMLLLDGDCVDPRAYSFPLLKTRIDSFIDIMETRKGGV